LAKEKTLTAHNSGAELPQLRIENDAVMSSLTESINATKTAAENLTNPEVLQKQLAGLSTRRMELELLQEIKKQRDAIVNEIKRLKERQILESAKSAAATGPITKKILELSEESITEIVRDTFTRETDRLRLERVTIARTRAEKGALLHQPKLVGTRQQVILPRVFSEGERSALGLAAFFTEAALDTSNSALILDDPVTSLDHVRRGLVAARIAEFGRTRQVVILSHDVAFVADLKREAKERGVSVTERAVIRSHTGERKPGACIATHPWKAKDVPERLGELRSELARIKKEYSAYDQQSYDDAVANWAGKLSESWERIFSQEIVGPILAEGGLEVRPSMVKILVHFTEADYNEFEASYSRISQWARRHDKSVMINYVAPEVNDLEAELEKVDIWYRRVKRYKS
jgi:ABC-type dipeptide/oligopeptide/nickel transport system ATPase subunit